MKKKSVEIKSNKGYGKMVIPPDTALFFGLIAGNDRCIEEALACMLWNDWIDELKEAKE